MRHHRIDLVIGAVLVTAIAGGGTAVAGPSAVCVVAQVNAPILLPDGSEHPAGSLKLCGGPAFTPVTVFQKAFVDGRAVGYFASRTRAAEAEPGGPPIMTFIKTASGKLALAGYALPSQGRNTAYIFEDAWRTASRRTVAFPDDATPTASITVIATSAWR